MYEIQSNNPEAFQKGFGTLSKKRIEYAAYS